MNNIIPKPELEFQQEELNRVFFILGQYEIDPVLNTSNIDFQELNQKNLLPLQYTYMLLCQLLPGVKIEPEKTKEIVIDSNEMLGVMSWDGFQKDLLDWIRESGVFEPILREKSVDPCPRSERELFHRAIANFFVLKPMKNYSHLDKMRELLINTGKSDFELTAGAAAPELQLEDVKKACQEIESQFSELEKAIVWTAAPQEEIGSAIPNINLLPGLRLLNKGFEILHFIKIPLELHPFMKWLAKSVEKCFKGSIFKEILKTIFFSSNLDLLWESLRALCYILSLFKVKDKTITDLKKSKAIKNACEPEFIKRLVTLSNFLVLEIQHHSLLALGLLMQIETDVFLFLEQNKGTLELILSPISTQILPDESLRYPSWFIAAYAGCLEENRQGMLGSNSLGSLNEAALFLLIKNTKSVTVASNALKVFRLTLESLNLSEYSILVNNIISAIREKLFDSRFFVKRNALLCIRDLVAKNEYLMKKFDECGLFPSFYKMIKYGGNDDLCIAICRIMLVYASKNYSTPFYQTEILNMIVDIIQNAGLDIGNTGNTNSCRSECVKIIYALAKTNYSLIKLIMRDHDLINIIFDAINQYEEQDSVLEAVYNYSDTYPNYAFVADCLEILKQIVVSEINLLQPQPSTSNPVLDKFGLEKIKYFETFVKVNFTNSDRLLALRRPFVTHYRQNKKFEERLLEFLRVLLDCYTKTEKEDAHKENILFLKSLIQEVIAVAYPDHKNLLNIYEQVNGVKIEITCRSNMGDEPPNGDNRIIFLAPSLDSKETYKNFLRLIEEKFDYYQGFVSAYLSSSGTFITIDQPEVLEKAIKEAWEKMMQPPKKKSLEMTVNVKFTKPDVFEDKLCKQCGASSKVVPFVTEWGMCLKCYNTARFGLFNPPEQGSIFFPQLPTAFIPMNWQNQSMNMGVSPGYWPQQGTPWQFSTPTPKFPHGNP